MTLRDGQDQFFAGAFVFKILLQFAAKLTGLHPHDIILVRVEIAPPVQHVDRDLTFWNVFSIAVEGMLADIGEEGSKLGSALKARTGGDPLDQLPSSIVLAVERPMDQIIAHSSR